MRNRDLTQSPDPNLSPNHYGPPGPIIVSVLDSFRRTSRVYPFPDLNLSPDSQATTVGVTARVAGRLSPPELDLNVEPIEESQTQETSNNISLDTLRPPPPASSVATVSNDLFSGLNRVSEPDGYKTVFEIGSSSGSIFALPNEEIQPPLLQAPSRFELATVTNLHGGLYGSDFTVPLPPPSSSALIDSNDLFNRFADPSRYNRGFEIGSNSRAIVTVPDEEIPPPSGSDLATVTNLDRDEQQRQSREIVKRTRLLYDSLRFHITQPSSYRGASSLMKNHGMWLNQSKDIVGAIPGVEIGDIFFHRLDLCVVGLHSVQQPGIDYVTNHHRFNNDPIATSIVVSGHYEDGEDTGDYLVYTGQGGYDRQLRQQYQDQRLDDTANLAMERSMYYGLEVRVIRGIKYKTDISSKVYVYDGLYKIFDYGYVLGRSGFGVCKFKLARIHGQPEMGSAMINLARRLRTNPLMVRPNGYITFDMSCNKESVRVYLYNDVDDDREPLKYTYLAKSFCSPEVSAIDGTGCDCVSFCTEDCFCVRKNGGKFAYDDKGYLLKGKPVVFECGTSCNCGPSCKNRVTQKGLSKKLEVFKSNVTGWGVRTLDIIHVGAFICEYAGVVVTKHQAEILSMNGDAMVYPDMFIEKWSRWGDVSAVDTDYVMPDYPSLPPLDFAIDVSVRRNVGSYVRHSREPNLMVQLVRYNSNNSVFPRVMLFAMENISPLSELTFDYGY